MIDNLPPVHHTNDPITSALAEAQITTTGARASIMKRCLWYIEDNPGKVAGEISEALGLTSWQVMKRLSDLKSKGLVYQDGVGEYENHKQMRWWKAQYQ